MNDIFMQSIKKTPLYKPLRNLLANRLYRNWEEDGKPIPPPNVLKQRVLREYAQRYGTRILIETGTFYGDMVEAMKVDFDHIYSVELSAEFYEKARSRFSKDTNIELIYGNSGTELHKIMDKINQAALFWLDGHYSGETTALGEVTTPIYEELQQIFDAEDRRHVILIDDARCFASDPAYPRIDDLFAFVKSRRSNVTITVLDDIIRIIPHEQTA